MNCKKIILLLVSFLLVMSWAGCANTSIQLQNALENYSKIVTGDIPQDLKLTIYYMDPQILTRIPLSAEDLINASFTQKIVIEHEELLKHLNLFQQLNAPILQPVKEKSAINARLYYVLESTASGKLLEVTVSQIYGTVFVNGIEVEDNPIFYELIAPFLTEEAHDILGV